MTPKEKALELYNKFWDAYQHDPVAHECALICVDEILETIPEEVMSYKPFMMNTDYWEEVKQEINKL
tara:strand:- start:28 stop:228 length:201 start_codon:yes stop_codon:yes gene_type:complete